MKLVTTRVRLVLPLGLAAAPTVALQVLRAVAFIPPPALLPKLPAWVS